MTRTNASASRTVPARMAARLPARASRRTRVWPPALAAMYTVPAGLPSAGAGGGAPPGGGEPAAHPLGHGRGHLGGHGPAGLQEATVHPEQDSLEFGRVGHHAAPEDR